MEERIVEKEEKVIVEIKGQGKESRGVQKKGRYRQGSDK
jgi:hypothetical protein